MSEALVVLRMFMIVTEVMLLFVMNGVFIYYGRKIYNLIARSSAGYLLFIVMLSIIIFMDSLIWLVIYLLLNNIQYIYGVMLLYLFWSTVFSLYIRLMIKFYKTLMIDQFNDESLLT